MNVFKRMILTTSVLVLSVVIVADCETLNAGGYDHGLRSGRLPTVYYGGSPSHYSRSRLYEPVRRHHTSRYRNTTSPRIYSHTDRSYGIYGSTRRDSDMYRLPYTRTSNYYRYRPYYTYSAGYRAYRPYYTSPPSYFRYHQPYSYFVRPTNAFYSVPFGGYHYRNQRLGTPVPTYYGCAPSGFGYRHYQSFRGPAFYGSLYYSFP